jgi:hypothetical protein
MKMVAPSPFWRERGVRVSQSLCPLTSILSPQGKRRYFQCYFLHNFGLLYLNGPRKGNYLKISKFQAKGLAGLLSIIN